MALVLRNLPTTILMSGDDLISLGLLPPDWPNHKGDWGPHPNESTEVDFPADRNLTETERYTNALLTISLGKGDTREGANDFAEESMDTDDDGPDLYNSKMAIPDSVFTADTCVQSIPVCLKVRFPPVLRQFAKSTPRCLVSLSQRISIQSSSRRSFLS